MTSQDLNNFFSEGKGCPAQEHIEVEGKGYISFHMDITRDDSIYDKGFICTLQEMTVFMTRGSRGGWYPWAHSFCRVDIIAIHSK